MKLKLGSEILDTFGADEIKSPIIISVPHAGVEITEDFEKACLFGRKFNLPDTDWYVDKVYSFAEDLGVYGIKARYSRYIIDLNRPLNSDQPLYSSRQPTPLVPTKTFEMEPIYKPGQEPTEDLISMRVSTFYEPYYEALQVALEACLKRFGHALLVDCHSIRSQVSKIQSAPFDNFVLGNRMGQSCPMKFLHSTKAILESHGFTCALNQPFQGGQITRHFHQTMDNVTTLQIEMSQSIYMDEKTLELNQLGLNKTAEALRNVIQNLHALVYEESN